MPKLYEYIRKYGATCIMGAISFDSYRRLLRSEMREAERSNLLELKEAERSKLLEAQEAMKAKNDVCLSESFTKFKEENKDFCEKFGITTVEEFYSKGCTCF